MKFICKFPETRFLNFYGIPFLSADEICCQKF